MNTFDAGGRQGRTIASPRARRAMLNRGMDASSVRGTGPGGRIVEADVLGAAALPRGAPAAQRPMRRAIARITSASAAAVPHFHLRAQIDAWALVELRAQLLAEVEAACGLRLSLTDLLLRALARALGESPQANSIWLDGAVLPLRDVAVGLVVGLEDGLLVPVIRQADQLGLVEMVRRRSELAAAARGGRLGSAALEPAASSVSNLGQTRVDDFSAVIYPPQSSMLAVGRLAVRPFVVDGRLEARPTLRLSLAVDHRVMDGGPAASFLGRIAAYLEEPRLLVV